MYGNVGLLGIPPRWENYFKMHAVLLLSALFLRCHEIVVIVVVAINRQYLHMISLFFK